MQENAKRVGGMASRIASLALAGTLMLAGGVLAGCAEQQESGPDLSAYPDAVQRLWDEYDAQAMTSDELIDGLEGLCSNDEITEDQLSEIEELVQQHLDQEASQQ